jgi:hypothetical protein
MPCAAASHSMPRMRADVGDHRLQPPRREGGHADMVLLVGAGRQAVDAGRVRQALVLAGQRGGGDVRDHEAAVQARVGRQEGRQARDAGVDQHRDAPLGDGADLGDGGGHRIAASATGSAWKLPPEIIAPSSAEHQRVVGHRIGLAQQHQRGVAQLVQAGAHHLRLAAQAVRVLHAVVAFEMALADALPASSCAVVLGHVDLPGLPAQRVDARVEGAVAAARGIDRQRADHQRRLQHRLEGEEGVQRQRGAGLRAVDQRQAFLGRSTSGAMPAARSTSAAGTALHRRRFDDELALAHQRQRHVRQRRQVARGVVAGVGVAHHAGGRVVPQHALDALGGGVGAVADDDHAGVLRIAHADAAAVVQADPGGAAGGVEQRVEQRPVADRVAAVLHRLGLAVGAGDRAAVEVVAADHDRRLQLARAHHLVERRPARWRSPRPSQQMRAGRPWKAMRSPAMSSQRCRCASSGTAPSSSRRSCGCPPGRPTAPPSGTAPCRSQNSGRM